jgi:hypothetical protein
MRTPISRLSGGTSQFLQKLDRYKLAYLVAEDPVTCCVYFNRLVHANTLQQEGI